MANQVQFIQLSQEEYDNISSKNPGSLYFTTDTHRIYKGGDLYASTTFDSLEFEDLSATSIKVDGVDVSLEGHTHTKSEISDFPTNVSSFTNDAGYITQSDVDLTSITSKIPEQASPTNQLADKDFVNSSIMTNTAYFKGTFNSVAELPTDRVTPNDYAFVVGQDSEGNTTYNRYKFTADGQWLFEYTLNNSSFTAEQWATINSGITSSTLDEYARKDEIDNTKIYSTKTAETSPHHGDRKILGNGEIWEYGSAYNFQVTLDANDPQKDTRKVTIVEKLYLNESKKIGWLYIITMDGDKDIAPSLWFPEKKDTFTFGYDQGNFTGSAVRKTEPEFGWKFNGEMVSENLMVDYVDSAIGQVLTTEVF